MAIGVRPAPGRSIVVRQGRRTARTSRTFSEPGRSRAGRAAAAVLVFLVTLPLQFQTLVDLPVGDLRWFHLGAVAMVVLNPGALRAVPAIIREQRVLVAAMLSLTVVLVVALGAYGGDDAQPVQHLLYAGVGLVFLVMLRDALGDPIGRARLVWAAPTTVAVTLVELVRRMLENGLDPVSVLRATVVDLDPTVLIYGVFRQGTDTGEVIQPANIRHEIMAAIVVAVLVTMLAEHARRYAVLIAAAASVVGGVLVVASLSRSVLLPLLIVALGAGVRVWLRAVLTKWAVLAGLALVMASPIVGSLLYTRFVDDTGSYEERLGAFSYPADELLMRIVAGGPALARPETSTHTLVFDTLFQAGWPAGVAAVVVVSVIAGHTLAAYGRYFRTGALPELVAVTAGTLAVVRAFTIGGGYLHQVEWIQIGLLLALTSGPAGRRSDVDPPTTSTDSTGIAARSTGR